MRLDQRMQRLQRGCAGANPVGQGGDVQLNPLAGIGVALAVQGEVVGELAGQHHGQQVRPGAAARDRVERCRWLGDRLAGPATPLLADRLHHLPLTWDHLQRFCDALAQPSQLVAPATRAGSWAGQHHPLAREVGRQRAAHGATAGETTDLAAGPLGGSFVLAGRGLQLLQLQFQLVQQLAAALGGGAEALVAQLGDQQLQVHHHRLRPRGPRLGLAAGELLGRQSGA